VLRHDFRPGRLVAGTVFVVAGVLFAGDAGGLWQTPWFVLIPLVTGGLCLAGAAGMTARSIRRRRGSPHRPDPTEPRPSAPL
jgi:drug/metabolite transporter (DMT)-like permease